MWFLLAPTAIASGLIIFARVARGSANKIDRLAQDLRAWSDKKEKHR
jgi:hypothetical protein